MSQSHIPARPLPMLDASSYRDGFSRSDSDGVEGSAMPRDRIEAGAPPHRFGHTHRHALEMDASASRGELPIAADAAFQDGFANGATQKDAQIAPGLPTAAAIEPAFEGRRVHGRFGSVVLLEPGERLTDEEMRENRAAVIRDLRDRNPGQHQHHAGMGGRGSEMRRRHRSIVTRIEEDAADLPRWLTLVLGTIASLAGFCLVWAMWRISHGAW